MPKFILCIYSCMKNLNKANKLYNSIIDKFNNDDIKIFIIYGDTNINSEYSFKENYLILNVNDTYEYLTKKTFFLVNIINTLFNDIIGLFKIDDDIILDFDKFNNLLNYINNNTTIDYLGKIIITNKKTYIFNHLNKTNNNKYNQKIILPNIEN